MQSAQRKTSVVDRERQSWGFRWMFFAGKERVITVLQRDGIISGTSEMVPLRCYFEYLPVNPDVQGDGVEVGCKAGGGPAKGQPLAQLQCITQTQACNAFTDHLPNLPPPLV